MSHVPATAAAGKRRAMQRIAAARRKALAARIVRPMRLRRTLRAAWVIAQRKVARVQRRRMPARRAIVRRGQATAARESTAALRPQAGALTIIAASRSSLHTLRATILHRGRIPPLAGVTLRLHAPTPPRQAAATEAEAAIAPRAVTVAAAPHVVMEAAALRAVMEVAAVRAAMVVEAPAEALIPAEVLAEAATRAVEVAVTQAAVVGAHTAEEAAIRIANLRC